MKKQPGVKYTVRCSDEDSALFEAASEIDGMSTVQQWMLSVCRKQARQMLEDREYTTSTSDKIALKLKPDELQKFVELLSKTLGVTLGELEPKDNKSKKD